MFLRYRPKDVCSIIDRENAGQTAQDVLGYGGKIPIVSTFLEARDYTPNALVIVSAPPGGYINEEYRDLNRSIENNSTSLRINKSPIIKLEILLANILNVLEECCEQENQKLISEWLNYCGHINKKIKFHQNKNIVSGIFKGINQNGQAIIAINNQIEFISNGIIEL